MKRRVIKILSAFFQIIDTLLCKLRIKRPKVVIFMDGGICSQMMVYLQGQYYAEHGFDVYFDTLWFETYGKDADGLSPRYFEFKEMWPHCKFKSISKWQRKWYLLLLKANRTNGDMLPKPQSVKRSMYLNGWWDLPNEAYERLWSKYFDLQMTATPFAGKSIDFDGTIGVHVRRGDLAKGDNPIYGGVSEGYFVRAIEFCKKQFKPKKYLFFSDEPDWVEQNICPHVQLPYELMRGNKGWEDLWLLAHCPVIVASQGSFGKVAARLNPNAVLIQCDNSHANRDRANSYFIK